MRAVAIWAVVAGAIVILAFIVGRPSDGQAGRTSTPQPSRSEEPSVIFGTSLDPQTNAAVDPVSAYQPGSTVAYSLTLSEPLAVTEVLIAVDRVSPGERTTVQEPTAQEVDASRTTFGVAVPADRLLESWGPGTYQLSVILVAGEQPIASGRFTLRNRS
jgi:hypothetical protein